MGTSNRWKHPEIARRLRREILRGFAPGGKLPSNVKLAERYATTPVIVRKALATLQREGLVETQPARGTYVAEGVMKRMHALTVAGVILPSLIDLEHPFVRKVLAGLQEAFAPYPNYTVHVLVVPESGEGRERAFARLLRMVEEGELDAVAVHAKLHAAEMAALWATGVALVNINRSYRETYPHVGTDQESVCRVLRETAREIGAASAAVLRMAEDPEDVAADHDLWKKVVPRLQADGVTTGDGWIYAAAADYPTEEEGRAMMERALREHPEADCVFLSNRAIILGAREALAAFSATNGRRPVPIALTDDEVLGVFPTVAIPLREIGRRTAKLLREQLEHGREAGMHDISLPAYRLR